MTPETFVTVALTPGLALLPPQMDTPEARSLILAIALQESGCTARRQRPRGPARSYLQFEPVGVRGILKHPASGPWLKTVCRLLDVRATAQTIHHAIEWSDPLAVCCARLLIRTLPAPLPRADETDVAYRQYLNAWRPGKPRPNDWPGNFAAAWLVISPPPEPT